MIEQYSKTFSTENLADSKTQKDQYFSVKIRPDNLVPTYKFRLRKSPSNGPFILAKEDSAILGFLKSGQQLSIYYHPSGSTEFGCTLKTQINYSLKKFEDTLRGITSLV